MFFYITQWFPFVCCYCFFNRCTFEKSAFWVLLLTSLQETWRHLVKNQEMLPWVRRVPSCQGSTLYLGIRGKASRCLKISLDELIILVFFLPSFLSLPSLLPLFPSPCVPLLGSPTPSHLSAATDPARPRPVCSYSHPHAG